ncbi:MAG TPA: hypothetical protein VK563_05180, partial [Puia sp.]|nr:hypothetical protein [Puia sp.]
MEGSERFDDQQAGQPVPESDREGVGTEEVDKGDQQEGQVDAAVADNGADEGYGVAGHQHGRKGQQEAGEAEGGEAQAAPGAGGLG